MARNTTKDFKAAIRYPFANRFEFGPSLANNIDHDHDNNKALTWSDAADVTSIPAIAVDADSVLQLDQATQKGPRGCQQFYLAANGSLATQAFFIADKTVTITGIEYSHGTLGTDNGAVTANITHETGMQAPGTGSTVQVGTFNCKATINTPQAATLLAVDGSGQQQPTLTLAPGDRLSIVFTGTLTALAGVVLTVYTTPGYKEEVAQYGLNANGSLATQGIFVANRDMVITGVNMIWSAAGTDSGTVTIDVTKDTSTNAPGAGSSILSAAVSAKTTANTVNSPTLNATATRLKLAAGDRLSVKYTGTLTALAGVVVCVYLQASSQTVGTSLPYFDEVDANLAIQANGTLATQEIFIADRDYEVVDASEIHSVAGTDSGSVTIDVQIDKGTTAAGSGTSVLGTTFNAKSTANTVQYAGDGTRTLSVARRNRLLSQGDRLAIVFTGTLTSLAGVDVTVSLRAL